MSNGKLALILGAVALVVLSVLAIAAFPSWKRDHQKQCIRAPC